MRAGPRRHRRRPAGVLPRRPRPSETEVAVSVLVVLESLFGTTRAGAEEVAERAASSSWREWEGARVAPMTDPGSRGYSPPSWGARSPS